MPIRKGGSRIPVSGKGVVGIVGTIDTGSNRGCLVKARPSKTFTCISCRTNETNAGAKRRLIKDLQ